MNATSNAYPEYQDHLSYIKDAQAKEAFKYMVDQSQNLLGYTARPEPHGYIKRNLHYFDEDGNSRFAFNIAQQWLLFYLQRPAETHPRLTLAELQGSFSKATLTKIGELNFRIQTVAEAKVAMSIVFDTSPVVDNYSFADEVPQVDGYLEGAVTTVLVNSFERNARAREACLRRYGYRCAVCEFDFGEAFGALGKGFIHVRHLREIATIRAEYEIDPINDLRPICPNCHAMLHRRSPPLEIEELKRLRLGRPANER